MYKACGICLGQKKKSKNKKKSKKDSKSVAAPSFKAVIALTLFVWFWTFVVCGFSTWYCIHFFAHADGVSALVKWLKTAGTTIGLWLFVFHPVMIVLKRWLLPPCLRKCCRSRVKRITEGTLMRHKLAEMILHDLKVVQMVPEDASVGEEEVVGGAGGAKGSGGEDVVANTTVTPGVSGAASRSAVVPVSSPVEMDVDLEEATGGRTAPQIKKAHHEKKEDGSDDSSALVSSVGLSFSHSDSDGESGEGGEEGSFVEADCSL